MSEEFEIAVKYNCVRMWLDLTERIGFQAVNKKAFLAAVEPEIRKALEESHERTKREGQRAEAPVDQSSPVGSQLGAGVRDDHEHTFSANNRTCYCGMQQSEFQAEARFPDRASCEDSWSCEAPRPFVACPNLTGHEFDGDHCIHCGAHQ